MAEVGSLLSVSLVGIAASVVGAMVGGGGLLSIPFLIFLRAPFAVRSGDRRVRRLFAVVVLASALRLLLARG